MGKESTLRAPLPRPRIRTYFRKMYHLPIYRLLLVLLGLPTAIMVVVKHLFFSSSSAYQKLKRELAAELEAGGLLQKLTEQATASEQNKARFLNTPLSLINGDFALNVIFCGIQQIFRGFQPVNRLQADSSLPRFTFFGSVRFALLYIFFKFKLPILIRHICTSFPIILPS